MKSKSMILMVVSLGFGLVAAIGISKVMGGSSGAEAPAPKTGPVLVAANQFDHGTLLTEENLKVEEWPLQIIPENAVTDLAEVKNMAITTRLSKGLAILKTDVVNKNELRTLAIPPGSKVVAIKVAADDTFNGLLAPGDKVDVIGVVRLRDEANSRRNTTISKTFLKNITVFSVNENMRAGGARELTGAKNNSIVSVLVNEKQSEKIVLIQKVAQLKLVLRGDDLEESVEDAELADESFENVFGLGNVIPEGEEDHGVKELVVDAEPQHTMRIYHGNDRQTFKFEGNSPVDSTVASPVDSKSESRGEVTSGALNLDDPVEFNRSNENESGFE